MWEDWVRSLLRGSRSLLRFQVSWIKDTHWDHLNQTSDILWDDSMFFQLPIKASKEVTSQCESLLTQGFQPQHYWHFGLDHSLLDGAALCPGGCLAAPLASTFLDASSSPLLRWPRSSECLWILPNGLGGMAIIAPVWEASHMRADAY